MKIQIIESVQCDSYLEDITVDSATISKFQLYILFKLSNHFCCLAAIFILNPLHIFYYMFLNTLIYYVKNYTLTGKFNFKCYCICEEAAVSSETLDFFVFTFK